MLEIVLVEMEAMQEIVGGLGKRAPRQEVSEKLGYSAGYRGRLFYLQKGDLLLVCSQEGREWGIFQDTGTPGPLSQPLWTPRGLRVHVSPNSAPLAAPPHPREESRHLPRLA